MTDPYEQAAGRWRALALLAITLVLSMSTWFSASAVVPQLRGEWSLSDTAAAWLTIAVQLGFMCGALASSILNLSDVVSSKHGLEHAGHFFDETFEPPHPDLAKPTGALAL